MVTRILRIAVLLVASWTVMTSTHELGHIVGGWCCGGTLKTADLLPWHLPYSLFDPDPMPLVTLWCGPILGAVVPRGVAVAIRREWIRFVANFCVLANRAYIGLAWIAGDRYLDTPQLLSHGAHPITIGVYCILAIGIGYVGFRRSCFIALTMPQQEQVDVAPDRRLDRQFTVDEQSGQREPPVTRVLKS